MRGPLPYIGGRSRLSRLLLSLIPEHIAYIEPFAGGAQLLFRKTPSATEILNDLNQDIVTFFRVCQLHKDELLRVLQYAIVSRKSFELLRLTNAETLTDIYRAARTFLLQKMSYGGMVMRQNYHYHVVQAPNFDPSKIPQIIEATYHRLQQVQIECLPYGEILTRYDRPTSFFFLDPPFYGAPPIYRFNFTPEDFVVLEQHLRDLKGRFLMTLNDRPEVRQIFQNFPLRPVEIAYSAQPKAGKRYPELLISNYSLETMRPHAETAERKKASGQRPHKKTPEAEKPASGKQVKRITF